MPKVIPEYREEAKKKIIAAGLEVMSQKGYYATTLDDIASHIGVSKTTLYLYFSNKDDLVIEIIRSVHSHIHTKAMEFFGTEPMLDAYVHLFDLILGNDLNRIGFTHDVLALSARNPAIRKIHEDHMNAVIDKATTGIICLQKKGKARVDADPRTMALGLISLMSGLSSLVLKGIEPEEIRRRFYEMGALILGIPDTTRVT
jgi:AcrR family transcriptional regulator